MGILLLANYMLSCLFMKKPLKGIEATLWFNYVMDKYTALQTACNFSFFNKRKCCYC